MEEWKNGGMETKTTCHIRNIKHSDTCSDSQFNPTQHSPLDAQPTELPDSSVGWAESHNTNQYHMLILYIVCLWYDVTTYTPQYSSNEGQPFPMIVCIVTFPIHTITRKTQSSISGGPTVASAYRFIRKFLDQRNC